MSTRRDNSDNTYGNSPNFPLAEVFGGAFAAIIFLYLIINAFSANKANSDLEITPMDIQGITELEWPNEGQGFVISCYGDRVRIEETGQEVLIEDVIRQDSPFLEYLYSKLEYRRYTNLIFLIFNGGNEILATIEKFIKTNCPNCLFSFILLTETMENVLINNNIPMYLEITAEGDSVYVQYPDPFILEE